MNRQLTKKLLTILVAVIITLLVAVEFTVKPASLQSTNQLKTFDSEEELRLFILDRLRRAESNRQIGPYIGNGVPKAEVGADAPTASLALPEYSTTNIQVAGVDEADLVKSDGRFVYVASANRFVIVEAYPPSMMKIVSSITLEGRILGLFINRDSLVILERADSYPAKPTPQSSESRIMPPIRVYGVHLKIYDVSKREMPNLIREISLRGSYVNSRMIGDWVYTVASQPAIYWVQNKQEIALPDINIDGEAREILATQIYHSDSSDIPTSYTVIVASNIRTKDEVPKYEVILTGYATSMYVSARNTYLTMPKGDWWRSEGSTIIHRIALDGQNTGYQASGEVPGRVLNQFSMDEYESYFRIATTTGQVTRGGGLSANHIYVLDATLNIVGRLEDLALGEQIHSARFMGDRCFLVTFKKIDPLFTIDMSNPKMPKILGKLKIPGYSDYLHPYDGNHIMGIGKETIEAKEGDFAWYQGLKISLFDVSDIQNPKEVAKLIIGDRGTESPVLQDHHAFLLDKRKGLLVIPILEAKIIHEKYPSGIPPNTHGEYVFQGAYVLHVSPDSGITVKGRITHVENSHEFMKSGYYFDSVYEIKRSFYIENVLYTISDGKIKANNLTDLSEISEVKLIAR